MAINGSPPCAVDTTDRRSLFVTPLGVSLNRGLLAVKSYLPTIRAEPTVGPSLADRMLATKLRALPSPE